MNVIVCVDNNGGMLFNHRRQSRDRNVINDIAAQLGGAGLFAAEYSAPLFSGLGVDFCADDSFLDHAGPKDYCFVENRPLLCYSDRIDQIIIYCWNRDYPADFFLDLDPEHVGYRLISSSEFAGFSHERITKEIYQR